nr:sporulation initiation factor Spo0A C-terminal domain-containing protein [Clostridia bacterium]
MERYQLCWPETMDGGLLLLVAVEGPMDGSQRAVPCRVVGRFDAVAPGAAPPEDAQERITRLLRAIGVPTNLRGYGYLRTALRLAWEHPEVLRGLNRRLYPAIAREHAATPQAIERAIRHAIAVTWERGGSERCHQLLGRDFSCVGERPSNGEMITLLADYLGR